MRNERLASAQAVILAGGHGRRMGDVTAETQKCLLPIDGQPILGQTLEALAQAFGSVNVILCIAYRADDVIRFVERNKPSNVQTKYMYDAGNSQTANIFRQVEPEIAGNFLGLPGDVTAESTVYKNGLELLEDGEALATVALSPHLNEIDTHSVAKVSYGRVSSLIYPPPKNPDSDHLREMDIWGLSENFYTFARRHPTIPTMSGLIQRAIQDNEHVRANLYEGKWVHIGYPEDLQKSMKNNRHG